LYVMNSGLLSLTNLNGSAVNAVGLNGIISVTKPVLHMFVMLKVGTGLISTWR